MRQIKSQEQHRQHFMCEAARLGGRVESLPLTVKGPQGEDLFIDILSLGAVNPQRVLLHVAGTHGVEGHLGASIQQECLRQLGAIPDGVSIVFVRCLNPWGMAHGRRVNSENIDLNRNFLSQESLFQGMPAGYRALTSWLNPERAASQAELFYDRVLYYVARYGFSAVKQAIGAGQYELSRGIYFGGNRMAEETRLFTAWLQKNLATVEYLWGLEIHSGLGPFGYDTLFLTAPKEGRAEVGCRIEKQLHHPVAPEDPQKGVGFQTQGDLAKYVVTQRPGRDTVWLLQEFGTYNPVSVLKALRNENMHHHFGGGGLEHWSKRNLMEVFYPRDNAWQRGVLERGVDLFSRSLGLLK